ncbi:hypothetical protein, variant [Aphanomyces invadans]|uniref:F-box/LRR-repeat protein 15-like leucin rich repeat domain-containing protein n=1 Tax=Aphanomyces invadans TaxID=157072 RepID=A0A024UWZ3_9STRA|nr:hypothetical protein, variant [Aphanomyces invadans]ETW10203.1 hypothetical protein, variant [Aphanomyces invadans]|eukprot:XP_008861614.1 hypothetical protein, variant [Aphanomyces invadans]
MGLLDDYYREVTALDHRRPQGRRQLKKRRPLPLLEKLDDPVRRPKTQAITRHPVAKLKEWKRRGLSTAVSRSRATNQEPTPLDAPDDQRDHPVPVKFAWRCRTAAESQPIKEITHNALANGGVAAAFPSMDASIPFFPVQLLQQVHIHISAWTLAATDDTFQKIAAHNHRLRNVHSNVFGGRQSKSPPIALQGCTKSIIANGIEALTDVGLIAVAKTVVALESLEIAYACKVTDAGMRTLALNCSKLTSLNISGCAGIVGAGLGAVSDHCHGMQRLVLADCPHLEDWVLVRAFYNFEHLTHVDLSACVQITDDTIKSMALRCRRLVELDLSTCPQLTDSGMVYLAEHCVRLERLNVSSKKGHLNERITDLALLSFGQHCPRLETLNVSGCTFISDVGVRWLAEGCHSLTSLNLNHVFKLTDVAMRALGTHTPHLQCLHVNHVKNISDVGLRFLSDGCPKLSLLHLKQLYLVSDGVKREFGLEGLQAVALSCPALTDLDVSGCFQIVERSLQTIGAHCKALKRINLRGCVKATPTGLSSILQGCRALQHINFTAIEQCTNACDRITDNGLRYLHKIADQLVVLNLSGCTHITDAGLSAFVSSFRSTSSVLQQLILNGCPLVTEDFLNRAALSCPLLLRLSVLGCGISTRVLSSLKTSWKYTVCRATPYEMGYFPVHRAKERRFMDESGQLCLAAIKIQNVYRLRQARREFGRQQAEALRHHVVCRLQSQWRGRRARKRAAVKRLGLHKRHRAAMVIQRSFRRYRSKQIALHEYEDLVLKRTKELAVVIQRRYRAVRGARIAQVARKAQQRWTKKRHEAATKMQRRWRGIDGRRKFKLAKAMRDANRVEEAASATQLQALMRGRQARKVAAARRQAELEEQAQRQHAAIRLQCMYRQRIARRKFRQRLNHLAELHRAATKMQCAWRARQGRSIMGALRMARERQEQEEAAALVQQRWRKRLAYRNRVWEAEVRRSGNVARLAGARRLQRWWRNALAIQRARAQMAMLLERKKQDDAMLFWAAGLVQNQFRRHRARHVYAQLQLAHECRWKQVIDTDNAHGMGWGAPFYYNQINGDVRWRMPSEVLSLQPQPPCAQCEVDASATVECSTCSEYFCPECFARVHDHGKRQHHVRRQLYNYYHKRIEYGDGEFPSVWPSEIDQDRKRPWDFIHHVPLDGYDELVAWIAEEDVRLYMLRLALQQAKPADAPAAVIEEEVEPVVEQPKPRAFDEDSSGNKIIFKPLGTVDTSPADDVVYQVKVDLPSDYSDKSTKKTKRKRRPLAAQKKLLHASPATQSPESTALVRSGADSTT